MNTKSSKEFFESYDVVALRADKGIIPEVVKEKLTELGNPKEAIPFYAVYGPNVDQPITFDAFISHNQVFAAIERAKGNRSAESNVGQVNVASQPRSNQYGKIE